MTPEQALNLIDNALGQLALNRGDHIKLIQAVNVLRETIGRTNDAVSKTKDKGGEAPNEEA